MLLRYEFPTEAPSMKIGKSVSKSSTRQSGLDGQLTCRINDCAMSCLELAVMKRLENVVQAITNAVSDFKLTSDNSDGVDAGSVSRKLLFEHEAKSSRTVAVVVQAALTLEQSQCVRNFRR